MKKSILIAGVVGLLSTTFAQADAWEGKYMTPGNPSVITIKHDGGIYYKITAVGPYVGSNWTNISMISKDMESLRGTYDLGWDRGYHNMKRKEGGNRINVKTFKIPANSGVAFAWGEWFMIKQ